MRRHLAALAGALTLLLGAGAGTALADSPTQAALQAAGTSQSATSDATSTQVQPSNSAISVRIGSPGNDGSVDQSNSSTAASAAANLAGTTQQATQDQSGSGTQAAEQGAYTGQSADSSATSTQDHPSNSAISVRIGSGGNNGNVSQSNDSTALSAAANAAKTDQAVRQDGSGSSCGCSGGGTQAAEQKAKTDQSASSDATSTQYKPSNSAISVRIGSPGNDGSVDQSNSSAAGSFAGNLAKTDQSASQDQGGSFCGCGSGAVQAAGQFAHTGQSASSDATSKQIDPSNSATSVRIGSPGNGGDVHQSNDSFAGSFAGNAALTHQTADQQQGSGGGYGSGSGVQALEQDAGTWQNADSSATSTQYHPSNDVTGVRIGSPGNDGSVDQSNSSTALSFAGNLAKTDQSAYQDQGGSSCGCGADAVQAAGQFAWTGQSADSNATSEQKGASNSVTPVDIGGGYGDHGCGCEAYSASPAAPGGGSVHQSNDSTALSGAVNLAATNQYADQSQGGGGPLLRSPYDGSAKECGCSAPHGGVQAVGQFAGTGQDASSSATSTQWYPSNSVTPVRIASGGGGGSVYQSNDSLAGSLALNAALTRQWVAQQQ